MPTVTLSRARRSLRLAMKDRLTRHQLAVAAALIVEASSEADVDVRAGLNHARGTVKKTTRQGVRFERALAARVGDSPPPLRVIDGGE